MKNALTRLENANIRSLDMYSGELVQGYLAGDMDKQELKRELTVRLKDVKKLVPAIEKLLSILSDCPKQVLG